MKIFRSFVTALLVVPFSLQTIADESLTEAEVQETVDATKCARLPGIHKMFLENKPKISSPVSLEAYKIAFDVIDSIADGRRRDQTRMKEIARGINAYLFALPESSELREFKRKAYILTERLKAEARRDNLILNSNISRLITCDGPDLLLDLQLLDLRLKDPDNKITVQERDDRIKAIASDLANLTYKFTSSRRFYVGLGASFAYIPSITFQKSVDIDLSDFDKTIGNNGETENTNSGRQMFRNQFSDSSYPALRITAETPLVSVDLMLSDRNETALGSTSISSRNTGTDGEAVLYRSNVSSVLSLEYDVQARLSIRDFVDFVTDTYYGEENDFSYESSFERLTSQLDFGFGIGSTGFSIENEITTEFRLKSSNDVFYDDLPITDTRIEKNESSFSTMYYLAYVGFEINDQMLATLEYRHYRDDTENGSTLKLGENSISFSFVYFVY